MPSPTAYRETIYAALAAQLATIATVVVGKTWNGTVTPQVERVEMNAQTLPRFPLIYLAGKDEVYEPRASESTWNIYVRTMTVRILYFVESWTPDTTISGALYDLELALNNPTLGGVVDDLIFRSNRPLYDEQGQPLSGLELVVDLKYRTTTNDPATRR